MSPALTCAVLIGQDGAVRRVVLDPAQDTLPSIRDHLGHDKVAVVYLTDRPDLYVQQDAFLRRPVNHRATGPALVLRRGRARSLAWIGPVVGGAALGRAGRAPGTDWCCVCAVLAQRTRPARSAKPFGVGFAEPSASRPCALARSPHGRGKNAADGP